MLYVSKGVEETTAPTTEPTTAPTETTAPEDVEVTKTIELKLPAREESYSLEAKMNGEPVADPIEIEPGTTSQTISVTGTGVKYVEIYINGEYYGTEKVDFTPNG